MRKIVSVREVEKRSKRNQLIVGIILVSLLLFSVLGYAFQGRDNSDNSSEQEENSGKFTYNGFEFTYQNGFWATDYLESFLLFAYSPTEGQLIGFQEMNKSLEDYSGKTVYIYSNNLNNTAAETELKMNLLAITKDVTEVCLQGEVCEDENLPIKTCEDNVIIIRESSEQKLDYNQNCVIISGKQESLIRLVDEFLFKLFKIKQ
ncbi:MAG TPA: hypothetical protein PLK34_02720 [Candidatus Pacearchaeota archaeon]|nr:hypothetical protein [Candidatus Pacearchaeota archaeon]